MSGRATSCVPPERLAALALGAPASAGDHDQPLLTHVARCSACAARLAALSSELDALRAAAWHEADAAFDESALETQRTRILERLAHLGKAARVIRFPARAREAAMPVSANSRRWVSVAAAAGLLIGLLAGQLIHFVPDVRPARGGSSLQAPGASRDTNGPIIVQASTTLGPDEALLDEIDDAMELRRAATLRAIDALTPHVGELVEIR